MERVVVTAAAGSFPGLAEALRTLDVAVEECRLIEFRAPSDWAPLDLALDRLNFYNAVALTSPRAAAALSERIALRGNTLWPRDNPPAVWAGGAATASALNGTVGPVYTPIERESAPLGVAETLARAMLEAQVAGPVLFPCGNSRRDELPERLRQRGIPVDEVVCYISVLASEPAARFAAGRGGVLVVASPSVAQLLIRACSPHSRPDLVAAGPTTADSARASGWAPAGVAAHPTADSVVAAVRAVLARRSSHE